jgi:lipoprotein-anchoring transpeptidase ErfK/SrfK
MVPLSRAFAAQAGVAGAIVAMLLTSCATSAVSRSSRAADQGGAQQAVASIPPKIAINPSDGSRGVALDSPVVVTASTGRLDSVKLIEGGSASPLSGLLSSDGRTWRSTDPLASRANYTVVAKASSGASLSTSAQASFSTLAAQDRLLTTVSPPDGSLVGVGEPIDLRFSDSIPPDRRADLLTRISIVSSPPVFGSWHWFSGNDVHFRTKSYWPAGTQVKVSADLRGFGVGDGTWGLGTWTSSFTVGDKHVSMIDDRTHTMNVYQNDLLVNTWPVSMGKSGFATIDGTLIVLYRSYVVKMNSCTTFGGAACIPGSTNYYNENVYYNTAVSSDGYFIHSAPWSVYAQGHYDVSHGCINLSPARATTFFNWSKPGDVVVVSNTGNPASSQDGEGDWQIDFSQFSNTTGLGTIWTSSTDDSTTAGRAV